MEILTSNDIEAIRNMYQQANYKSTSINDDGTYNLYLNFGFGSDQYKITVEQLNYITQ